MGTEDHSELRRRLEQLRAGHAVPRRYRNRRIGEFLKELDLTEGRATGIPKILRAMRRNGSPPPEFDFDEDHSYFQVRLPARREARSGGPAVGGEAAADRGRDLVADPVADPVLRLLAVVEEGERSPSEIQQRLKLRHRPTFRKNYLHPALARGLVEMTRPETPTSRLQRYRITAEGRAWLRAESRDRGTT